MKKLFGYILWYCEKSDDGLLRSFDGNQYYFNAWSFSGTKYEASGESKKTGKIVTIRTRHFPGLFISYIQIKDKRCKLLKTNTPISFRQANGTSSPWAVDIKLEPQLKRHVLETRLVDVLDGILEIESDPRKWYRDTWLRHADNRINSLLDELENTND